MINKQVGILGIVLLFVFTVIAFIFYPHENICSDEIRGYKKKASLSLDTVRTKLSSVKASLRTEDNLKVPQLKGLSIESFSALRACDTHCKLLHRCLRFVFLTPPSEACPTEYSDYKKATKSAMVLINKLKGLELAANQTSNTANDLVSARGKIEEVEKSAGATGAHLAILKKRAEDIKGKLATALSAISHEIDIMLQDKKGVAE